MNEFDEKIAFNIMDALEEEKAACLLERFDPFEEVALPSGVLPGIKQRTYGKLSLTPLKRQKNIKKNLALLAASLFLFIFLGVAAIGTDTVMAALKQVFQFIPGFNLVLEEDETANFILPSPLEQELGGGTIRLEGVSVGNERTIIHLSGYNVSAPRKLILMDSHGREYIARYSSIAGNGTWRGYYYCEKPIVGLTTVRFTAAGKESSFSPLLLEKARTFKSYADLGPTVQVNEIAITAFLSLEEERLRAILLSPPFPGERIYAYASHLEEEITLKDKSGEVYTAVPAPGPYKPPQREFLFNLEESSEQEFTLTIPSIQVAYYKEEKYIDLPLPQEGALAPGLQLELAGFPVEFIKIIRLDKYTVGLFVDVLYDEKDEETLLFFNLNWLKMGHSFSYFEMKHNEQTGALEYLEFPVRPGAANIRLHLKEPVVLKRGPWEILLSLNEL